MNMHALSKVRKLQVNIVQISLSIRVRDKNHIHNICMQNIVIITSVFKFYCMNWVRDQQF